MYLNNDIYVRGMTCLQRHLPAVTAISLAYFLRPFKKWPAVLMTGPLRYLPSDLPVFRRFLVNKCWAWIATVFSEELGQPWPDGMDGHHWGRVARIGEKMLWQGLTSSNRYLTIGWVFCGYWFYRLVQLPRSYLNINDHINQSRSEKV